jgi:hypothetical protein
MNQVDLKRGQELELYVLNLFRRLGYECWLNDVKTLPELKACDLYIRGRDGATIPVEVKSHFRSLETGNVAIEPTAALHSKSSYVVNVVTLAYLMEMPKWRNLLTTWPTKIPGGDYSEVQTLLPVRELMKESKLLTPLN